MNPSHDTRTNLVPDTHTLTTSSPSPRTSSPYLHLLLITYSCHTTTSLPPLHLASSAHSSSPSPLFLKSDGLGMSIFFPHIILGGLVKCKREGFLDFEEFMLLTEKYCMMTDEELRAFAFECLEGRTKQGYVEVHGMEETFLPFVELLRPDGTDGLNVNTRLFQQLQFYHHQRAMASEKVDDALMNYGDFCAIEALAPLCKCLECWNV